MTAAELLAHMPRGVVDLEGLKSPQAEALRRLADYLERLAKLRGRVINALIYPVILCVMVVASVGFLMAVVVPQFQVLFESLNAELPWYSQGVLDLSLFVRAWWWALLLAAVLAALWLASGRLPAVDLLLIFTLGTFLMRSAGWCGPPTPRPSGATPGSTPSWTKRWADGWRWRARCWRLPASSSRNTRSCPATGAMPSRSTSRSGTRPPTAWSVWPSSTCCPRA